MRISGKLSVLVRKAFSIWIKGYTNSRISAIMSRNEKNVHSG